MRINGLQKLTLLDFPGHTACTVFTPGCNLRCPFCHNADLVFKSFEDEYDEESFFAFLSKRRGVLDGVCITGGEPLLQTDIIPFIEKIRENGFSVKLDTNGFIYSALEKIVNNKLVDYIAMDIKNTYAKYSETVGIDGVSIESVKKSIKLITDSGIDYEFRTTAVKEFHSPDDFTEIAGMINGAKRYFIQNFVDSGGTIKKGLHSLSRQELELCKSNALKVLDFCEIRGI